MSPPPISAYVPYFNNVRTIRRTVESLANQTVPPSEIVVVDDGSVDDPTMALSGLDVRVVRHPSNLGRGAARARAMREVRHEFVLGCDAGNILEPAFVERALPWFDDPRVAAVVGRMTQEPPRNVAERWRGRHLFKLDEPQVMHHGALLSTWGALVRASAVNAVGGYDPRLRHSEDRDLGERLLRAAFDVVFDATIDVISVDPNTIRDVLERYWRWYAGVDEGTEWRSYRKSVGYSIKVMVPSDLRAGDPLSVPVSLVSPHYQFWRSWLRRRRPQRPPLATGGAGD